VSIRPIDVHQLLARGGQMTPEERAGLAADLSEDRLHELQQGTLDDSLDQPVKVIPRDETPLFKGYIGQEKFLMNKTPEELGEVLGIRTKLARGVYVLAPVRPLMPGDLENKAYTHLPGGQEYNKTAAEREQDEYPPGKAAPQWTMTTILAARIIAELAPKEPYLRVRAPLSQMVVRTAELDRGAPQPDATARLNAPVGGAWGNVRSAGKKAHKGWDLYAEEGTPVHSISWGMVVRAVSDQGKSRTGYGNEVLVRLLSREAKELARSEGAESIYALYAHLKSVMVKAGDPVWLGRVIGLSGKSGNAYNTPPHLHFGLRRSPGESGLADTLDPGLLVGFGYYMCDKGQTANPYLRGTPAGKQGI
jgi:murein DD-endopeptidase MepM/ murein hydrolase activator NlpD